ncbi:hypothetical protein CHU98_g634 [Xylaria longipes]|nr:hypothetical protein CHU98_g634 [Xylaria longipes]
MLRWHDEGCRKPQLKLRKESIDCLACRTRYLHQADDPGSYHVAPITTIKRRSCLNLTWPRSVEYSKTCIAEPGGKDLSCALITFLGAAPHNKKTDVQQDEKLNHGFLSLPSNHHIRVLHLSPARQPSTPLHGHLDIQDLNERPYYEALSYTWKDETGDASVSRRLYVGANWDILPITKSCSRALRRLRFKHAWRVLWVDAICINQQNNAEKSEQIALMRTIYARSVRCVVDLGNPSFGSDIAIDYANSLGDDESMDQLPQQHKNKALSDLFHRRYFNRVWVIQEIVSAPYAQVNCGSRSVDWRLLVDSTATPTALNWIRGFRDGIGTGRPTRAYNGPSGLLKLLRDTADSESSDPRDKIFALLGLVRGLDLEGITADYDLTYEQVYTGLAAYFIKNHGLAELTMMATHKDPNLPSWVPNWRAFREYNWNKFSVRPRTYNPYRNDTFLEAAKSVLVNSHGSERLRSIMQTTDLLSEQPYRPEIHGETGALIHEASCLFSFRNPAAEKGPSRVYTRVVWKASQCDVLQFVIVTLDRVTEDTDVIACFVRQKIYVHLRKTAFSTYRILGEAMIFLHESSERPTEPCPPDLRHNKFPFEYIDLFTDFITLWYEKVSNASELWEMFIDPPGSGGIRAKFSWESRNSCMFYYRASTIEEAYNEYVSLKKEIGSVEGVLRSWISGDGQFPLPSAVGDLIECIIYWQDSQHWGNADSLLLPISVGPHLAAWVNANIIWQRWLAMERILAERHENAPVGIVEFWKDLTDNLVIRLNIIADEAHFEPFSITANEPHMQENEFDKDCEESLNDTFAWILHELDDIYSSRKPRQPAADHDQVQVSSLAEPPGTPEQNMDTLGLPTAKGWYGVLGFHHDDSLEDATDTQCPICIDLDTRIDAFRWKEHWKMPKSRGDIKRAVRALGVTTYGDRRRTTLLREPDARRAAQTLGSLLDLSIRALSPENIVII